MLADVNGCRVWLESIGLGANACFSGYDSRSNNRETAAFKGGSLRPLKTFRQIGFPTNSRDIPVYLMRRQPDEEIPEEKKE